MAKFCALYIRDEVESAPEYKDGKFSQSLTNAFHRMDERMRSAEGLAQLDTIRRSLEKSALGCSVRGTGVVLVDVLVLVGTPPTSWGGEDTLPSFAHFLRAVEH